MTRVLIAAIVFFALMLYARADENLPGGVSCETVQQYAAAFNIPNTTLGRLRAKIIAAALGMRLTSAQLDAAARCLARSKT